MQPMERQTPDEAIADQIAVSWVLIRSWPIILVALILIRKAVVVIGLKV